jgi:galactokinase
MSTYTLDQIYRADPAILAAQRLRYMRAHQQFRAHFGHEPTAYFRTPGRINLIGEHTDYNGGFVLPVALDKDVLFAVRPRTDDMVQVANIESAFAPFSFALTQDIPPAPAGDWRNYFQGAAQELCRTFGDRTDLEGMEALVSSAPPLGVPRGAGLSSSTALTVNAALALLTLNGLQIERPRLAHLCSEAEWYVGTRGGMMDQFSALLCRRGHALFLDCRPSPAGDYQFQHVPVPSGVQIVLLDSGVHHENARGAFNQRVAECKIGVRLLQQFHPSIQQLRDVTPHALGLDEKAFWSEIEKRLPSQASIAELVDLGLDREWIAALVSDHRLPPEPTFTIRPRCRHVITENERVLSGVAALRAGEVATFGRLMNAAHASMSDDYGASCPEVDALVSYTRQQKGVLGARITGAGWGGGVVALVHADIDPQWQTRVQTAYQERTGLECQIVICEPGDAAGQAAFAPS